MSSNSSKGARIVSSRNDLSTKSEVVRRGWLFLTGFVGLASVLTYVALELKEVDGPWSGLALELGAGVLLFALLFLVERRMVSTAVTAALARITRAEKERVWADPEANPLTPGDFHSETGPLAVASAFVRDVADGNFADIWLITDRNWRTCRAQAWIFNNLKQLDLLSNLAGRDQLAEFLVNGPHPDDQIWQDFVKIESKGFRAAVGDFHDDRWGWSQRRRIVGPSHEVVFASPLPLDAPDGFMVDTPTLLEESIQVLVSCHRFEGGVIYLVAGLNQQAAPLPGWPPTWWSLDDPAATACHPGLREVDGQATPPPESGSASPSGSGS